jgi:hypothetical protein
MESAIGSRLLESLGGGVYGLACGGEGTCGQRLNMLRMAYLCTSVDDFLSGFEELLGELSELENFSFDEWVS